MDRHKQVLEWFDILKRRPLMILSDNSSYNYLQSYIEGYIDALSHSLNKENLRADITFWFQKKVNEKTNFYWTNHIPLFYKDKSDQELQNILIETTSEFFRENPQVLC